MAAANTTVVAAFAVGVASFVSPCVLPLVPGYLSSVSGVSIDEMRGPDRPVGRILWPAAIFCLSFTVLFVALGMTATGIGSTLADHRRLLDRIAGTIIIALGVLFVLAPVFPRLAKEWRPDALMLRAGGGPILAGAAFAVAWTPCVGPTLGAILSAASLSTSPGRAGLLLAAYSAGLAIPFLLSAVAFRRMTLAFAIVRRHHAGLTAASGAVLVVLGLLVWTGELAQLNGEAQRVLDDLGLNIFEAV